MKKTEDLRDYLSKYPHSWFLGKQNLEPSFRLSEANNLLLLSLLPIITKFQYDVQLWLWLSYFCNTDKFSLLPFQVGQLILHEQ